MAEALAILGAIRTSQQVLWDFSQLVRRYRHLPGRIQDLEENLNGCHFALRVWKRKWGISDHHPDLFYEILWGKRGWREIQMCLQAIKDLSFLVQSEIDRLVGSAFKYQGHGRLQKYDGRFDRHSTKRALERIDKSMSRKRRFFWSIILRANDMDAQVARFETKLTNLERLAEGHLYDTHPEIWNKDPSQWYQQRQGLVEEGMRGEVRKAVRYTRQDAESLHSAWAASDETRCHLAIANAGDLSSEEALMRKRLHFVLVNGEDAKEIKVKYHRLDHYQAKSLSDSFNDVTKSIYRSPKRHHYLLPPGATDIDGFKIKASSRSSLTRLDARPTLSALLKQAQSTKDSALMTEEKLAVAVGLVEGCYRYLGTPWLTYLDSANIRGDRTTSGAWIALLQAKPGNRSVNQALIQLSTSSSYKNINLESHKQIFRLGIILTELAVGSLVSYAETSDDIKVPGVNLVFQELADDDRLSAEEIAAEVENRTGSEVYANLVKFCLSVLQSRAKIKTLRVDDAYERELLDPSRDLTRLLES